MNWDALWNNLLAQLEPLWTWIVGLVSGWLWSFLLGW